MPFAANALWSAAAGMLIPVMAILNGGLARALGSAPAAACVLFAVALGGSLGVLIAAGRLPHAAAFGAVPAIAYCGGLIVGFYVLSVTTLAPRFGVGNTILFAVSAQVLTSAVIDQFGLFGAAERPVSAQRLAGLALVLAGLVIANVSRAVRASP